MGQIIHRDVQASGQWDIRRFLGEINDRLSAIVDAVSVNRHYSVPQVTYTTSLSESRAIWMPLEEYRVESVTVVSTAAAGTVDVEIDGVGVGGSTPFALTTSPVTHEVESPNETSPLSRVSVVTSSLGAGICTVALNIRRLN